MSLGGSYNTGIQSGPSLSGQDYQTALNRYNQIGRAPMSRPIGPAYGGAPPAAGGMFNQGRAALGTDAGNQASNAFSNTVNQGQSQLAAGQAGAQSQVGNATQGSLANIYSQDLGRGADLNTAQANNLLNRQRLGYGLAGNLFGTGMGLAGQAISPLLNGVFQGIGNIPQGLQNLMQPGLSGGFPQSQVGGIGNNALSSILAGLGGSNQLASIGMGGGLGGGLA